METKLTPTEGTWLVNETSWTVLPNGDKTAQHYTISTTTDFNQKSIAKIRAKSANDPYGLNHCLYSNEECVANAELICDAGNTFQKCHLLPSRLLQQRDILLDALQKAVTLIQGYQAQYGEGPTNKNILAGLKETIKKTTE